MCTSADADHPPSLCEHASLDPVGDDMSEQDPNATPRPWQEPPNDWGQLPPEWQQPAGPLPLPPPPAAGYQQPYTPYNPYGPQPGQRTESLAIASLVVSLVGILCFGVITGLVGIGLGVAARGRIDRDPSLKGRGLATAGIIVGACVFLLSLMSIFVLAKRSTI
jgi:hypothetical protein